MPSLLLFILGSGLGSFYCLAAERIPQGESILFPASHCTQCQQKLHFYEMMPLLSIIVQHFRCRHCSQKIPFTYFFSELAGGIICVLCFSNGVYSDTIYSFLLLTMGMLLSLTDLFYLLVEPKILYFFVTLLLLWHLYFSTLLYFSVSVLLFGGLTILNKLMKQSIGGGDILLLSFWGLFLGWQVILWIIFIASSSALIYALFYHSCCQRKIQRIPFVPFLSLGLFLQIILTS